LVDNKLANPFVIPTHLNTTPTGHLPNHNSDPTHSSLLKTPLFSLDIEIGG